MRVQVTRVEQVEEMPGLGRPRGHSGDLVAVTASSDEVRVLEYVTHVKHAPRVGDMLNLTVGDGADGPMQSVLYNAPDGTPKVGWASQGLDTYLRTLGAHAPERPEGE